MKFIIPILVGAIIGYTTNWLAIRMLFRPYYKKYFLGIHIPFTPGLIPKERDRIARSIGETVGSYLLTPEVVMESLDVRKLDSYIRDWVESSIDRLKGRDGSIRGLLTNCQKERWQEILPLVQEWLAGAISVQLRKKDCKQRIEDIIYSYISASLDKRFLSYMDKHMNKDIELFIYNLLQSDNMKIQLTEWIRDDIEKLQMDDRSLKEVLPKKFILAVREFMQEQDKNIIYALKDMLENPAIELQAKKLITNLLSQHMGKLITMFISLDTISEKIFHVIKESIDKPEAGENIILIVNHIIDRLLDYSIRDLIANTWCQYDGEQILRASDVILNYISSEGNIKNIAYIIKENIKSYQPQIQEESLKLISHEIDRLINSDKLNGRIYVIIEWLLASILDRPISSIIVHIKEIHIKNIIDLCKVILDDFVENKLASIVKMFNISQVVEKQINSFDVEFAEKIILQISHRELRAITWLGALLGGIMGMLSPILQKI